MRLPEDQKRLEFQCVNMYRTYKAACTTAQNLFQQKQMPKEVATGAFKKFECAALDILNLLQNSIKNNREQTRQNYTFVLELSIALWQCFTNRMHYTNKCIKGNEPVFKKNSYMQSQHAKAEEMYRRMWIKTFSTLKAFQAFLEFSTAQQKQIEDSSITSIVNMNYRNSRDIGIDRVEFGGSDSATLKRIRKFNADAIKKDSEQDLESITRDVNQMALVSLQSSERRAAESQEQLYNHKKLQHFVESTDTIKNFLGTIDKDIDKNFVPVPSMLLRNVSTSVYYMWRGCPKPLLYFTLDTWMTLLTMFEAKPLSLVNALQNIGLWTEKYFVKNTSAKYQGNNIKIIEIYALAYAEVFQKLHFFAKIFFGIFNNNSDLTGYCFNSNIDLARNTVKIVPFALINNYNLGTYCFAKNQNFHNMFMPRAEVINSFFTFDDQITNHLVKHEPEFNRRIYSQDEIEIWGKLLMFLDYFISRETKRGDAIPNVHLRWTKIEAIIHRFEIPNGSRSFFNHPEFRALLSRNYYNMFNSVIDSEVLAGIMSDPDDLGEVASNIGIRSTSSVVSSEELVPCRVTWKEFTDADNQTTEKLVLIISLVYFTQLQDYGADDKVYIRNHSPVIFEDFAQYRALGHTNEPLKVFGWDKHSGPTDVLQVFSVGDHLKDLLELMIDHYNVCAKFQRAQRPGGQLRLMA